MQNTNYNFGASVLQNSDLINFTVKMPNIDICRTVTTMFAIKLYFLKFSSRSAFVVQDIYFRSVRPGILKGSGILQQRAHTALF